jgi:nucleoside-diphosphate-sugar epimerase
MKSMTIAIVGGTGTPGRQVAAELEARGNQVRPLSRHAPEYRVDLATGDGLGPAPAGCDVVVDASNSSARKPAGILVDGSRRLTGQAQPKAVRRRGKFARRPGSAKVLERTSVSAGDAWPALHWGGARTWLSW